MYDIRVSATMVMVYNISTLAHTIEDLFYYLQEEKPSDIDCSVPTDLLMEGIHLLSYR